MNIEPLKRAWSSIPVPHRLLAAVIAAAVVGLLLLGTFSFASTWSMNRHAKKFDAAMAKKDAQVQTMQAERDTLLKKAEAAEALAADRANALAALYAQQPALEQQAAAAEANLGKALESYESEKSNTNRDVLASDRLQRYCRKRAELGYPCSGIAATGAAGK